MLLNSGNTVTVVSSSRRGSGRVPRLRQRASSLACLQREVGPMQNMVYLLGDPAAPSDFDPAWEIDTLVDRGARVLRPPMEVGRLLMLCCRRSSVIGTPASPCFRMLTIWLPVNRDFRMGISLAPESLPSHGLPGGEAYGSACGGGIRGSCSRPFRKS